MTDYEYYFTANFKEVRKLGKAKRWRVISNIRFPDLKGMVQEAGARVHICKFCRSTDFQLFEVKPPRSTRVRRKLVANCLEWAIGLTSTSIATGNHRHYDTMGVSDGPLRPGT